MNRKREDPKQIIFPFLLCCSGGMDEDDRATSR